LDHESEHDARERLVQALSVVVVWGVWCVVAEFDERGEAEALELVAARAAPAVLERAITREA